MSDVNALIPLSVDPSSTSGPDIGKIIANAQSMMKLRQAQQDQQQQNALRNYFAGIYGANAGTNPGSPSGAPQQPGQPMPGMPGQPPGAMPQGAPAAPQGQQFIDPLTGQPMSNALRGLMARDPDAGMAVQKNALAMQRSQSDLQKAQMDRQMDIQALVAPTRDAALEAYDDALKNGLPKDAAEAAGQRALDDGLKSVDSGGALSDSEKDKLQRKFDPDMFRARALSYKDRLAQAEKDKSDKRADAELGINKSRNAREQTEFNESRPVAQDDAGLEAAARTYITKGTMDPDLTPADRKKVRDKAEELRKAGVSAPKEYGNPVPVTVKDKDGKETTTEAVYDKDGAKWLTADGRRPIEGDVMPAKEAREEKTAGVFSPRMGELMAALAEQGVSVPAGFRSKQQQAALYQSLIDRNPELSADEIAKRVKTGQIEFAAQKKETQTAAGIAGKVEVAQNELTEFIPLVRDASTRVPRGKFVPITRLIQMGEGSISDPDLKQLRTYINSTLNAYDILAGRGGTDKDKREEAHKLLTSAESPEALEAGLKAFEKEAEAARRAAVKATKVPELPDEGGGGAKAASGAAPEMTEDQYNKAPSGARYRVPGNPAVMVKP